MNRRPSCARPRRRSSAARRRSRSSCPARAAPCATACRPSRPCSPTPGTALRQVAAVRPLALILDDAHYADQATTDAVEYATLAEAAAPLWACVLARPVFDGAHPAWAERSGAQLRVTLGPLARAAAVE